MILKLFYSLISLIASLLLFGDIFYITLYNNNYLPEKSFAVQSSIPLSIPRQDIDNAYFITSVNSDLSLDLYTGPHKWDHTADHFIFITDSSTVFHRNETSFSNFTMELSSDFDSIRFINTARSFEEKEMRIFLALYREDAGSIIREMGDINDTLRTLVEYHMYSRQEQYGKSLAAAEKLHICFPGDKTLFKNYIIELMNNTQFSEAENKMDSFFRKYGKDDFYYSLKLNIAGIRGLFNKAEEYLIEGRLLFPESIMLIDDAVKLYSVIDTSRMTQFIELRKSLQH
ncbi:MAG: hypothetical protein R6U31_05345 [bacterium]